MLNSFIKVNSTEDDNTEVNTTQVNTLPFLPHPEGLLHRITLRIRQSLELQEILEATVAEVRSYLGTDRVKVYCFREDGSGEVIAEALNGDRLPSLLGLSFPADDIPPYARELFVKARQRVIVDVGNHITSALLPFEGVEGIEASEQEFRYRPVDPCHVEYLTAMQVMSSVVVPILHQKRLWGLLVSHHSEQRTVTEEELQFIGAVADQVELAIAQSILLQRVQAQADQEAKINRVSALLHTIPTVQLQGALEEAVKGLEGVGGRLYLMAGENAAEEFYTCGEQPTALVSSHNRSVEQHLIWQQYLRSLDAPLTQVQASQNAGHEPWSTAAKYILRGDRPDADCWAINDIYQEPLLRTLVGSFQSTQIRGMMIVPLRYDQQTLGCFTIFRQSVEIERLWAGRRDSDPRQMLPQMSFEAWRELRSGQPKPWTEEEKRLARSLSGQFATAVQQYHIYSQVQRLNAGLESQVQSRTAELEQMVEQQQSLLSVVTKIHNSLDLDVIFQTTTSELRQLLQTDRVAIYRFNPDWSGEFIAESVGSDWVALVQPHQNPPHEVEMTETEDNTACRLSPLKYPADTHLQATQGGPYARGTQFCQVNDIYAMGFSPCYVAVLESYQCRAYVIVPIFQGAHLWGLLATYQNSGPRQWIASEVSLMVHTAVQLGVATQQAELLARTQQQAEQLAATLEDLRQTQSQLIQTEKMSSLGQLVAGVAHEINNPVNFINGNLLHAREYTGELLDLLQLYQQYHPDLHPEVRDRVERIDLDFIAEDLPKLLTSMQIGADRIRQIVLSLRNFSRIDQAEVKPVNIHDGLDSTLLILQHRLKATPDRPEIEVIKEYGVLPLVECYAGQLNQVFMNILTNAIDALEGQDQERSPQSLQEHPSRILIRTHTVSLPNRPPAVVIRIADNGPGMDEKTQARLFDPFFTTKPIGRGTGLGLSISYQIIRERHRGNLRCISKLGKGTEFQIQIPLGQTALHQQTV